MTILLINFAAFLAAIYLFFSGSGLWTDVFSDRAYENDNSEEQSEEIPVDEKNMRFPFWILL